MFFHVPLFIGLPVRATCNSEMRSKFFLCQKKKWRTELPEDFACPIPPSVGPIFAGRGQVISGHLANRIESRLGMNTTLFFRVIGPISMPNDHDYLSTVIE